MRDKVREVQDSILDRKKIIETFHEELEMARTSEVLNKDGIMLDSKLTIEVVEAEDLRTTQSTGGSPIEPYIVIEIEGQQAETQEAKTTKDPKWNEIFTFDIVSGKDQILV